MSSNHLVQPRSSSWLFKENAPHANYLPSPLTTSSVHVYFKGACALHCQRQNDCYGFFYDPTLSACYVDSYSYGAKTSNDVNKPGLKHFKRGKCHSYFKLFYSCIIIEDNGFINIIRTEEPSYNSLAHLCWHLREGTSY